MFQKNGKFYADWRTPDGKRHRKAFPTQLGAKRYETTQRAASRPTPPERLDSTAESSQPRQGRSGTSRGGLVVLQGKSPSPKSDPSTSPKSSDHGKVSAGRRGTATIANQATPQGDWCRWRTRPIRLRLPACRAAAAHRPPHGRRSKAYPRLPGSRAPLGHHLWARSRAQARHRRTTHTQTPGIRPHRHQHQAGKNPHAPDHTAPRGPRATRTGVHRRCGSEVHRPVEQPPRHPGATDHAGEVAAMEETGWATAQPAAP